MGLTSHRQALPGTEAASLDLADQAISERKPLKPFTDIIAIIDRSGSMNAIKAATEEGFNGFVREQQSTPGECALSLYQFDDRYEVVYEDRAIREVPPFELTPRASTALLDALGRTITARGAHYAGLPEEQRPEKVVVVVVTDGEENSSKEYTLATIKELVSRQKDTYQWQFVFLGANMDAVGEAVSMGFSADHAMTYGADEAGVMCSYGSVSKLVSDFKSTGPRKMMKGFSAKDREDAVGGGKA